jgi:hypothetical protein
VPSDFKQKDLEKAQADGLISDDDQVVFPSTDCIPKPPSGFRVMFLAFPLRGLSFLAHEFLRGLLFVHDVQLQQLNSSYCLFYHPLRIIYRDQTPLSSLEIPLLAPPQCRFIKKA